MVDKNEKSLFANDAELLHIHHLAILNKLISMDI